MCRSCRVKGLLIRKNFQHSLVDPSELPAYSTMKTSKVSHRQLLPYSGSFARLEDELSKVYESAEGSGGGGGGEGGSKLKVCCRTLRASRALSL